jgi:hypothetical protein
MVSTHSLPSEAANFRKEPENKPEQDMQKLLERNNGHGDRTEISQGTVHEGLWGNGCDIG